MKASVGAVELLFDPRHPLKRTTMNNDVTVMNAFIRCFPQSSRKIGTQFLVRMQWSFGPEIKLASRKLV
jgi:hypothetical protein